MSSEQVTWLIRRLRRMYWREVPYRFGSVVRTALRRMGLGGAKRVPALRAGGRFGRPWCGLALASSLSPAGFELADELLAGRLEVFGHGVAMPGGIPAWNADPVSGRALPLSFGLQLDFRHIPGLDIKHLWEVNRLLWWVPLAQAWASSRDRRYLDRLARLLDDWMESNPYALGPNWSSPVEHAIRLINWSIVWHLVGGNLSPLFDGSAGGVRRERWLASIYQHMHFAADNYSFYSSADNHLIGEAAGVFVAAQTWDLWPQTAAMRARARRILEAETLEQFAKDGVNREQALCYHKFSLQFLLAAALSAQANGDHFSDAFWSRVGKAVGFLAAVTDIAGQVPKYGDSDDGDVWRLARPDVNGWQELLAIGALVTGAGSIARKCGALGLDVQGLTTWLAPIDAVPAATCGAGADEHLPVAFPDGGYALLGADLHERGEWRVLVDCGPLGYNRIGGHAHADGLAVLLSCDGEELLVDPGTYCYNAAPEFRRFFRGTSAHNTLMVDGQDQAAYGASFLWLNEYRTTLVREEFIEERQIHAWHDGYRTLADPVRHHRRVRVRAGEVVVEDWLECRGAHEVQLFWHVGTNTCVEQADHNLRWSIRGQREAVRLEIDGPAVSAAVVQGSRSPVQGWVSSRFYHLAEAPVIAARARLAPGQILATTVRRTRMDPVQS